jgi:hypothetical protein
VQGLVFMAYPVYIYTYNSEDGGSRFILNVGDICNLTTRYFNQKHDLKFDRRENLRPHCCFLIVYLQQWLCSNLGQILQC